MPLWLPTGGKKMPLYTPIRLQMPLCPPKCPALCPQMPRERGRGNTNAPIHARKCPYLSGGGNNPLVFDLSESVSVYSPPLLSPKMPRSGGKTKCPQNAPLCARGRVVCVCASNRKRVRRTSGKCPILTGRARQGAKGVFLKKP